MGLAGAMDAAAAPFDRARAALLGFGLRAGLAPVLARRERRLALTATLGLLLALGLTIAAPAAVFVVGPILLGVPHVASDVRYLLLRRGVPAALGVVTALACAAFIALRILDETRAFGSLLRLELGMGAAWILVAMLFAAASTGSYRRLAVALPVLAAITFAALRAPRLAQMIFVHAHNLVAVGVWVALFRSAARRRVGRAGRAGGHGGLPHRDRGSVDLAVLIPLAALAAATALLLSTATLPWTFHHGAYRSFGLDFGTLPRWLAPGLPPILGAGVASSYIFLQSVHYSAWLAWIPQDDVRGEGTLTFRMSARSLLKDFRAPGLALIGVLMLVVLAGAFAGAQRARDLYISLAMFHGYLELAMIGYFAVRGAPRGPPHPPEERTMSHVTFELRDRIAVVTMDDGKANALSDAMIAELLAALARAEKEATAVVLAGRPERFCAGFDLEGDDGGPGGGQGALLARGSELLIRPLRAAGAGGGGLHGARAGGWGARAAHGGRAHRRGGRVPHRPQRGVHRAARPVLAMELARDRLSPAHLTAATLFADVVDPERAIRRLGGRAGRRGRPPRRGPRRRAPPRRLSRRRLRQDQGLAARADRALRPRDARRRPGAPGAARLLEGRAPPSLRLDQPGLLRPPDGPDQQAHRIREERRIVPLEAVPGELEAPADGEQRRGEGEADDGRPDREAREDHRDADAVAGLVARVLVLGAVVVEPASPARVEMNRHGAAS